MNITRSINEMATMATTPTQAPTTPTTINALMATLLARYEAEGGDDPLTARFTLAGLWEELAMDAGEELPAHVAAALDRLGGERVGEPTHLPLAVAYGAMRGDGGAAGAWLGAD